MAWTQSSLGVWNSPDTRWASAGRAANVNGWEVEVAILETFHSCFRDRDWAEIEDGGGEAEKL